MPSPDTSSSTTTFSLSGYLNIDALLNPDHQIWSNSTTPITTLTYSFPWSGGTDAYWQPDYSTYQEPQAAVHFGLNATQISATRNALQAWANVANITFTQVPDTATNVGDFRFAFSSAVDSNTWGYSYYPSNTNAAAADVWINPSNATKNDWYNESYNYYALMHEIGHGLGLKHPGNYNVEGGGTPGPYLPMPLDYTIYTIMSYNNYRPLFWDTTLHQYITVYPQTPMVSDIAAIQYLYGSNNYYNTGDNTYRFDPAIPFYKTIWDTGGTDTIDLSNFSTNCTIDLTPGNYSSIRYTNQATGPTYYDGSNNLGIAFGVTIENVMGGTGNDYIIGNNANNIFIGGSGNDTIDGGQSIDTIIFTGKQSNYNITLAGTGFSIIDTKGSDGTVTEINVEKLRFPDHTLTIQTAPTETLAESYRMYKAAFDRAPDYSGLGYWYSIMNKGESITEVAENFINSTEFKEMYGTNPTDQTFVTLLYQHVLDRTPDQNGYDFWINSLHTISRAQELAYFSESAENKANLTGIIANGIIYEEYTA